MDGFERWARTEIEWHRREADQLEHVLAQFLATGLNSRGASPNEAATPHSSESGRSSSGVKGRRRASKNDVILEAFDAAGLSGLSMEQIMEFAQSKGISPNRNALRAYCWNQKQLGRLISVAAGRYASAPENGGADKSRTGETAPPAREPHSEHREADAGGGT